MYTPPWNQGSWPSKTSRQRFCQQRRIHFAFHWLCTLKVLFHQQSCIPKEPVGGLLVFPLIPQQLSALSPESVSHALVQWLVLLLSCLWHCLLVPSSIIQVALAFFDHDEFLPVAPLSSKKDRFPMDWTPLIVCLQFAVLVRADRDILDFALFFHASFSALVLVRSFLTSSPPSTRPLVVNCDHRSGHIVRIGSCIVDTWHWGCPRNPQAATLRADVSSRRQHFVHTRIPKKKGDIVGGSLYSVFLVSIAACVSRYLTPCWRLFSSDRSDSVVSRPNPNFLDWNAKIIIPRPLSFGRMKVSLLGSYNCLEGIRNCLNMHSSCPKIINGLNDESKRTERLPPKSVVTSCCKRALLFSGSKAVDMEFSHWIPATVKVRVATSFWY